MIIFETLPQLVAASLQVGKVVNILGETTEGDKAVINGRVRASNYTPVNPNQLITIANGNKVELFPGPGVFVTTGEMRTDSASQLGGVYKKDYETGDVIPPDAMKDKLMYWHNGQFYSVGTDTGFTSNDFDADLAAGRFVSAELTTQVQQWRSEGDIRGWGAPCNGVDGDSDAINACVSESYTVKFPPNKKLLIDKNLKIPTRAIVYGYGSLSELIVAPGITAFDLANVRFGTFKDFRLVPMVRATAIKLHSPDQSQTSSQFNSFYNVSIDGELRDCYGLVLSNTWTNQFHSCHIMRCNAVTFGLDGDAENSCNANHFFGCELRGVNTNTKLRPILGRVGDNNIFFGGAIENWGSTVRLNGGKLSLKGVYLEAFSTSYNIEQYAGSLAVDGCFRGGSVKFFGGDSLVFVNNQILDTAKSYKISYPFISVVVDTDAFFTIGGNNLDGAADNTGFYLYRAGHYFNGTAWVWRTKIKEDVSWLPSEFNCRMSADANNVTGDGTAYRIAVSRNEEFDYGDEVDNNGMFIPVQSGTYQFSCNAYLGGLVAGNHINLLIKTSDRSYHLHTQSVGVDDLIGGTFLISGTCLARVAVGDAAYVQVTVSNGLKNVSVLRGDAVNAYTSFSGFLS